MREHAVGKFHYPRTGAQQYDVVEPAAGQFLHICRRVFDVAVLT